jgi:hypothetical protein
VSDDLVAFLRARLDEDEAAAKAAAGVAGPDWAWKTDVTLDDEVTDYLIAPGGTLLADTRGGSDGDLAEHIARHDPARVLREVEAARAIVAAYLKAKGIEPDDWADDPALCEGLHMAIYARAAVYSDHPDYRQEWKP